MPAKRGLEMWMRKKMTSGIMGLTRPRFGKRSGRSLRSWREVLGGGGGGQIRLDKIFSKLTKPRFGKRNPSDDLWRCMISLKKDLYPNY